jgi:hypothetical protein
MKVQLSILGTGLKSTISEALLLPSVSSKLVKSTLKKVFIQKPQTPYLQNF